jgi:hypothetical protein
MTLKLMNLLLKENFNSNLKKNHALDSTTPWYNFNLYCECCYSLGFNPSVNSYVKYNTYYKSLFIEK